MAACEPVYRTEWEDGDEVEIFTMLPVASNTPFLQLRIYTKADSNAGNSGVSTPEVAVQCCVPAFVHVQQAEQRVLVELLCTLGPSRSTDIARYTPS